MQKEEKEYTHGATILRQGEEGSGFCILLAGAVEVFKDDVQQTVLMFPGTIFGEMADILGKARTCTIKAKGQAKIAFVKGGNVEELIREQPDVAMKIMKTLASRLERTTQKLADQHKGDAVWSVKGGVKPGGG